MNHSEIKTNNSTNKDDSQVKIYLGDAIKGVRKFWWLCVALAVILGSFRAVSARFSYNPVYTSTATLTVNTRQASAITGVSFYSFYYDATSASQLSSVFPFIVSNNLLQDAICADLDIPFVPASLNVTCVSGTNMIKLSATGTDPQKTYDVLQSAIKNIPTVANYCIGSISFETINSASVPKSPSNRVDYTGEFLKGAIIGAVAGIAIVLVYVLQRKTIKTKTDIKNELNLETISTIPLVKKKKGSGISSLVFTSPDAGNGFRESFRVMRNVLVASLKESDKIIMATSSVPGEGKTTVITNLALALGDYNKRILLIDADTRHPSILPMLGIDPETLEYQTETNLYRIAKLEDFKISVLVPNPDNEDVREGYGLRNTQKMFAALRDHYDYILVDTPPCGLISDAMYVAQAADAAIYIIHQDAVRTSRIKSGLDSMMSTDIRIIGCVLNGAIKGITGYGYGYSYGYGYGYGYGKYGYSYGKYGYGYGSDRKHKKKKHRSES